ncbi:uncharacterized protein [Diadema antillarum]|uniref:uncharacterized protein n=1 Tax=Diadema antillarum TaxID=105358 RepID=UPI003A858555
MMAVDHGIDYATLGAKIRAAMKSGQSGPGGPGRGGKPLAMPRVLGQPETATKTLKAYREYLNKEEVQKIFDEKLDFRDANVFIESQRAQLELSLEFLDENGLSHLKPMFGLDKIFTLRALGLACYNDCPMVMKELADANTIRTILAKTNAVAVGDTVPDLNLVTLGGSTVSLQDLHVNKGHPLMILASSAS